MRFKHFIFNEQDPMLGGLGGPGGPGGDPMGGGMGGPPGGDPMGGGMGGPPGAPPGGDPMGGGIGGPPGGAPPGMGGPPGGGGGMAPQVPVNMKDRDVWEVLGELLGDKQPSGENKDSVLQSGPQPMKSPGFLMQ